MGFSEASALAKIGLGLFILAFVFDIIGFPSPHWISVSSSYGDVNFGLFQACHMGKCGKIPSSIEYDWFKAARALNILGFLLGLGCMIVGIIYVAAKNDMKILQTVGSILGLAAGFFIVIGSAIYGAKFTEGAGSAVILGWSFALTVVGGVLYLVAGVVLLSEKCMVA